MLKLFVLFRVVCPEIVQQSQYIIMVSKQAFKSCVSPCPSYIIGVIYLGAEHVEIVGFTEGLETGSALSLPLPKGSSALSLGSEACTVASSILDCLAEKQGTG